MSLADTERLARQIDPGAKWTKEELGWAAPEFVLRRAKAMRKARALTSPSEKPA